MSVNVSVSVSGSWQLTPVMRCEVCQCQVDDTQRVLRSQRVSVAFLGSFRLFRRVFRPGHGVVESYSVRLCRECLIQCVLLTKLSEMRPRARG